MTTKEKEKEEEMTPSQFAPTTSRTMDVLVAINVLIATQQGLEDAYVVAQQAINYPPVVGLGEMPHLRRLQSPLLEQRLGQNPRVSPSQRRHAKKGANAAWAEG